MEIQSLISMIRRRALVILLTLIATLAVVAVITRQMTPVYEASTTLRVAASSTGSIQYSDYMYVDRLMNTYVRIATSQPLQNKVVKELGLGQPPTIKAEIITNTEFIKITVENSDPGMAARIANEVADVLAAQSSRLFVGGDTTLTEVLSDQLALLQDDLKKSQQDYATLLAQTPSATNRIAVAQQALELKQSSYSSLLQQYEQAKSREAIQAGMITVFETATVPAAPSQPRPLLNMLLGFIVGLMGGLGLALLFENLDTTLYSVEGIESFAKLPTVARIPKAAPTQVGAFLEGFSPMAEAFRNLAMHLQLAKYKSRKALLVASAEPNQGKSMLAFHLACALAELGKKVAVVDCDTRKPMLHTFFQVPNGAGLREVLEENADASGLVQSTKCEGVQVLTSGSRQLAHPSQELSSSTMRQLIEGLNQHYDYVLLDSPAMSAVADVAAIAPYTDGVILVVRQGHAKKAPCQAACNFLATQEGKPALLVVNQAEDGASYGYYKARSKPVLFPRLVKGPAKGKTE